jgi:predicted ester cyclase
MSEKARDLVHKIYSDMWNPRQFQLCDTLLDENFLLHLLKTSLQSRGQYKKAAQDWIRKYPNIHYDVKDIVAEGNKIAVRWEGSDKSKNFSYKGQTFLLIINDKVKEAWEISQNE